MEPVPANSVKYGSTPPPAKPVLTTLTVPSSVTVNVYSATLLAMALSSVKSGTPRSLPTSAPLPGSPRLPASVVAAPATVAAATKATPANPFLILFIVSTLRVDERFSIDHAVDIDLHGAAV